jgi:hypothetical protein
MQKIPGYAEGLTEFDNSESVLFPSFATRSFRKHPPVSRGFPAGDSLEKPRFGDTR